MGKEIQVNSLEEMCDLMCDNKLPDNTKMTIEQAKLQLNDLLEYCAESGEEWEKDVEALKMAIEALEQEPCGEAITRILRRMWNCRGKHTASIDKVKMEQIIRDELQNRK